MNRRNFIVLLTGLIASTAGIVHGAVDIWLKPGLAGYTEKANQLRTKKNEICSTCKYFKDNGKHADGGLCNFKSISKGLDVYVKKVGVCSMYQRNKT